jgi:DNA-binding MarR family transcriptional regulator
MKRLSSGAGRGKKATASRTNSRESPSKPRGGATISTQSKTKKSVTATVPAKTSRRTRTQEGNESMATHMNAEQLVGILRETVVALVRRDGPDLSARQLGVFLTVYLTEAPHTVRGLAAELNVSKPAITRALDRLGELDLARRKVDPMDRRSVLVQRTLKGAAFLRDMRSIMTAAEQAAREGTPATEATRRAV